MSVADNKNAGDENKENEQYSANANMEELVGICMYMYVYVYVYVFTEPTS